MTYTYKVTDLRPVEERESEDTEFFYRFQKMALEKVGITRMTLWKQFQDKGYFENKHFKIEKQAIL